MGRELATFLTIRHRDASYLTPRAHQRDRGTESRVLQEAPLRPQAALLPPKVPPKPRRLLVDAHA